MVQAVSPCLAKYTTGSASLMIGSSPLSSDTRTAVYVHRRIGRPACRTPRDIPGFANRLATTSAREQKRVAFDGSHAADDAVGSGSDLLRRLPFRSAVAKQLPVRALDVDVGAGAPLVRAVIPFQAIV